jgi:hypothetical protein
MTDLVAFLVAIGPFALGITKVVDLVRNSADPNTTWPKWSWNVLAFGLGIAYACLTATNFVNLIATLQTGVQNKFTGTAGQIVTGLAIGGVASFHHEWMSKMSAASK